MKTPTIGFIGGGRVTRILLQAFAHKKVNLLKATVYDNDAEVCAKLKTRFPDINIGTLEQAAIQEIVIVSLHPPVIVETLEKIRDFVTPKTIIGSLAPKITSAKIRTCLPQVSKIIRMIPNANSVINEGFNPIWFAPTFPSDEKEIVFEMLDFLGPAIEVAEQKLEAYAVISAMAPTYFWFQWKKLVTLGEEFGLTHNECKEAVLHSMYGALNTYFSSGMSPAEVMDLIPLRPLGENEKQIEEMYDQKLKALYTKLTS